jgi:hypothetical protein
MANDPQRPIIGALAVDATPLQGDLVDLAERERQGMRAAQPGFNRSEAEITANQPTLGERAGITSYVFQQLLYSSECIQKIDEQLPAVEKLLEILVESRAYHDDRRQRLVSGIAQSVEAQAAALGDQELLAKYQYTREYRSAIARKAARTRQRNQELANEPGDEPVETPVETPAE